MAEPLNNDIVETTFNYTEERRDRSYLGFSDVGVFEGDVDQGPGVYHVGDVVQSVPGSGEISFAQSMARAWTAQALAQAIAGDTPPAELVRQLYALGETADEMYSAYLS